MTFARADKILIVVVGLMALSGVGLNLLTVPKASGQTADISKEGQHVETITLRQGYHQEIRLGDNEHYNVIEIDNGRVRVKEANCPDQLCVRTGWVSAAPQQIVCLPYRVVVKVESAAPSDVDDITK
jgi:hypothetical protein